YKSLLAAKDYSRAEKVCKKMLKQNRQSVQYYVYLGHVYKLQEDVKKEKEAYDRGVRELTPTQPSTQMLANAFLEYDLYDYALDAYNKAATKDYPYHYEKADVYKRKNDLKSMINEYLDALEFR